MKKSWSFFAVLLFVSAPSFATSSRKLIWDTAGGGQIHFEVTPPSRSGGPFTIYLESHGFQEIKKRSYLSRKQDPELYDNLSAIFSGTMDVPPQKESVRSKSKQSDAPTGTWTSVFVVDSEGRKLSVQLPSGLYNLFKYLPK